MIAVKIVASQTFYSKFSIVRSSVALTTRPYKLVSECIDVPVLYNKFNHVYKLMW
jgi:hypothetical protein